MTDTLTAKAQEFKPWAKASEGQHQCVLVDVIDLKWHDNIYMGQLKGEVHKCALVWQIEEVNPDTGKRFEMSKDFTLSMGEKANLRKFLGTWRGKSYSDEEAEQGAPLHKMEGVNGIMQIEHKQSKSNPERSYANIVSVTPLFKGTPKINPEGYVRADFWKDKIGKDEKVENFDDFPDALRDQDDDLPF